MFVKFNFVVQRPDREGQGQLLSWMRPTVCVTRLSQDTECSPAGLLGLPSRADGSSDIPAWLGFGDSLLGKERDGPE